MEKPTLNVNTMRILLLILTLLTISSISSKELPLKHIDTVNRLSNNKINVLHRDADGFLWIGTSAGLFRYDGHNFKNYAPLDSAKQNSFAYYIERIQEDAHGRLWIYSGLKYSVYDPVTDEITTRSDSILHEIGIEETPNQIFIDQSKGLWVQTLGKGLSHLEPKGNQLRAVSEKAFADTEITDLISTPRGVMTIDNQGTIRFIDPADRKVILTDSSIRGEINDGSTFVFTLIYDRDGLCWIFSNERLWLYDINNAKWLNHLLPEGGRGEIIKILTQDRSGKLWIGRDHYGLEEIVKGNDKISFQKISTNSGQDIINTVTALYEDNEGTLWVGTYKKGLYYHNPSLNKFALRSLPDVNCIVPSRRDGTVWIGTDAAGVMKWNPATDETTTLTSNNFGAVTSLFEAADGTLYIGSFSGGLKRYRNGVLETIVSHSRLDEGYTWSIADAGGGNLWIGTLGSGLFHFNPTTLATRQYTAGNSDLRSDYILKTVADDNHELYIATSLGVNIFNPADGSFMPLSELDGISINDLIVDSRGLLWIASSNGLKVYDTYRKTLSAVDIGGRNLHPNLILGLKEDKRGDIWVAEGGKLICLKVKFDDKTGALSYTSNHYDTSDGLQNSDFNQRSFGLLPDGEMLVGGLYGINRFYPDRIVHNRHLPKVMFSDIYIGPHRLRVGEKINGHVPLKVSPNHGATLELWPSDQSFMVSFASDNYVLPEKNTYQYMLEGLDNEWISAPRGVNYVAYTNLAPGNYKLLVRAINGDGYESTAAAELPIIIHPPFLLSPLAKVLYAVLIIAGIYLIYRLIRSHERRRFNEKRKEDAIRKQEEINQLKFKFYTNVSHELRTPLTLIVSPLESMLKETKDEGQRRRLTLMRNNAMRLLTLVNQLLDFRKNEVAGLTLHLAEGEIVGFVRNVCHAFAGMSERKNIRLNFTSDMQELNVMFDEDKLNKAIMNLLANAFKFTPEGGEVTVGISTSQSTITISVADNGIGISDNDKTHIFERFFQTGNVPTDNTMTGSGIGLSMVSEYVKLHDGNIRVTDNPGGGSIFIIELPIVKGKSRPEATPAVSETVSEIESQGNEVETTEGEKIAEKTDMPEEAEGSEIATTSLNPDDNTDKPTVLVVDDSRDMIDFLRDGLGAEFHVITAPDGASALKLLSSIRPAIILTDLMMPGMDGIELCRRIKADPNLATTPIIILTAKHDVDAKVEGMTVGADDYITKPFNIDLLILKMKKLVSLTRSSGRALINPEPDSIQITPLDEKMVEKAVKYVVTNIKRPELSVEELSSHLGMSRVHLYKKLKATTGKSPVEFIRLIRLKRGAQMLRESQLNVSEIAYQIGYNNPKYFSKYFKEEFGVLPSVYQNKEEKATNYPV